MNENCEKTKSPEAEDTPKAGRAKASWIKKLSSYSPPVYQTPTSPIRPSTLSNLDVRRRRSVPETTIAKKLSTNQDLEMPDLESIIREFEKGFLSPTKSESPKTMKQGGNFVKKIVAAFEVKYKTYNDLKSEQEIKETEEQRTVAENSEEKKHDPSDGLSPKKDSIAKKAGIFDSTFDSPAKSKGEKSDYDGKSNSLQTSGKPERKETKTIGRSFFSSPFRSNQANANISDVTLTTSMSSIEPEDLEEDPVQLNDRSNLFSSPFKSSRCDTLSLVSVDLSVNCADFLECESVESDNASESVQVTEKSDVIVENDAAEKTVPCRNSEKSREKKNSSSFIADKSPNVVGAFLKKPIVVQNTSIDWIPITGKKLPRKRSLKKLLAVISGKKAFEKKGKALLFSSEKNLNEEPRELQDSGYDEKSCSSSSLTSLVSITDALLQQEISYVKPSHRIATFDTFKPRSLDDTRINNRVPEESSNEKLKEKKLLLHEIPREELKADLGPAYPSSIAVLTMSLDRRDLSRKSKGSTQWSKIKRVPKHPLLSKKADERIPKHPFVSMTKLEREQEQMKNKLDVDMDEEEVNGEEDSGSEPPVRIRNDLYEVELRRSPNEFLSPASYRGSLSSESGYDIPRAYLSKSDSGLNEIIVVNNKGSTTEDRGGPIYDVPQTRQEFHRPRSSVYDDVLSLRRRNAHFAAASVLAFYAITDDEPHYATIKPRTAKHYVNPEIR